MYDPEPEDIDIQRDILGEESDPFIIRFYFNNKQTLYGFIASGQTGFTQYGLDIIAAGVSALVINTVHSLQNLSQDFIDAEIQRNYTKCILPNLQLKNRGSREALTLLKSLEIGIHSIQNTYGEKYITIEKIIAQQKSGFLRIFK